jgi:2-keto-3-deoxy-L-rhamnonate aldolase RhmA
MDLCYGLGLAPGNFADPVFKAALAAVLAACAKHGRAAGMFGYNTAMAAQSLGAGFDFASAGTDGNFLRSGATQALSLVRGGPAAGSAPASGEVGY